VGLLYKYAGIVKFTVMASTPPSARAADAMNRTANIIASFSFIEVLPRLLLPAFREPSPAEREVAEKPTVTRPETRVDI
jgi:hypothetical protein